MFKSPSLIKLSLQKMKLTAEQLTRLFKFLKNDTLIGLDLSWNKIPSTLLPKLFEALENNRSLE